MTYITDILDNAFQVPDLTGAGVAVGANAFGEPQAQIDEATPGGVRPVNVNALPKLDEHDAQALEARNTPETVNALLRDAMNGITELTAAALILDEAIEKSDALLLKNALAGITDIQKSMENAGQMFPAQLGKLIEQAQCAIETPGGVEAFSTTILLKELDQARLRNDIAGLEATLARIDALPKRADGTSGIPNDVVKAERETVLTHRLQEALDAHDEEAVKTLLREAAQKLPEAQLAPRRDEARGVFAERVRENFAQRFRTDEASHAFLTALDGIAAIYGAPKDVLAADTNFAKVAKDLAASIEASRAGNTAPQQLQKAANAVRYALAAEDLPDTARDAVMEALRESALEAAKGCQEAIRNTLAEELTTHRRHSDLVAELANALKEADINGVWELLDEIETEPAGENDEIKGLAESIRECLKEEGFVGVSAGTRQETFAVIAKLLQAMVEGNRADLMDEARMELAALPSQVQEMLAPMLGMAQAFTETQGAKELSNVGEIVLKAICNARMPPTGDTGRTPEALQEELHALGEEIVRLRNAPETPGDTGIRSIQIASLAFNVLRNTNAIEAKQTAAGLVENIVAALNATDPAEGLKHLTTVADEIFLHRDRAKAVAVLADRNSSARARMEARQVIAEGPGIGAELLRKLETAYRSACGQLILKSLPPELAERISGNDLGRLALVASRTGSSPQALLRALTQGLEAQRNAPGGAQMRAELIRNLIDTVEAADPKKPTDCFKICSTINAFFAPGLPELADDALLLKEALLPGAAETAKIEHALTLAHSRVMQRYLDRARESSSPLVRAAMSRVGAPSARSFILTPDVAKTMKSMSQEDPIAFNFEVANLAVLERTAITAGLLPISAQSAEIVNDFKAWTRTLALPQWAADYAVELDARINTSDADPADQALALRSLVGAAELYGKGFAGTRALKETSQALEQASGALERDNPERLFENAPGYREAIILNRLIADLTGLIYSEDRLTDKDRGLGLRGDVIDQNMRARTVKLFSTLNVGEHRELAALLSENVELRNDVAQTGGRIERQVNIVTYLANLEGESIKLTRERDELIHRMQAMPEDRDTVRFAWFGWHNAARREATRAVLGFCEAYDAIRSHETGTETLSEEALADQRNTLEAARQALAGVDPEQMRRKAGLTQVPEDETIVGVMRQRAQALAYFDPQFSPEEIKPRSQAQADALHFEALTARLNENTMARLSLIARVDRIIGEDFRQEIRDTVAAAFLKVSLESPRGMSVSLKNKEEKKAIVRQLESWNVPVRNPIVKRLIMKSFGELTLPDGTFSPEVLDKYFLSTKHFQHEEGRAAVKDFNRGKNIFTRRAARFEELSPEAAKRGEGSRRILELAAAPGSTVVYTKTRGANIDTGALYMPWSKEGDSLFSNSTLPLTAQIKNLQKDSFSVSNLGPKGYQVLLKDTQSARFGGSVILSQLGELLSLAGIKPKISAGVGRSVGTGVALCFPDRATCAAFIDAMLKPESSLEEGELRKAILAASQIQEVEESGKTADISVILIKSIVSRMFAAAPGVGAVSGAVAATAGLALKGEVTQSVQSNAQGAVVSLKRQGTFTASVGAAGSIVGTSAVAGKHTPTAKMAPGLIPASAAGTIGGMAEIRLVTNESGVSEETSLTESYNLTLAVCKRPLIRHFMQDKKIAAAKRADPAFKEKLSALLDQVQPGDAVAIKSVITPEALAAVRRETAAARMAGVDTKAATRHLEEVGRILNEEDSYRPAKIVVTGSSAKTLLNWSPGFGMVQFVRNNTLATNAVRGSVEINLLD